MQYVRLYRWINVETVLKSIKQDAYTNDITHFKDTAVPHTAITRSCDVEIVLSKNHLSNLPCRTLIAGMIFLQAVSKLSPFVFGSH